MTRNQYSDNLWQKSVVLTVKNHGKYGKTTFFDKNKKICPKLFTSFER